MWIVQLALRRPYTFVIMSLVIVILGVLAIVRMPTDIFPEIDIPVVSVIWQYGGISPEEMAEVITVRSERGFTTSVNDIEHMESQSLPGLGIIKVFFHPRAKIEAAVAQLAATSQSVAALAAHRHDAAQHHPLQRLQRAHPATGHFERHALRAAALRLRLQLHPHPDGERRRAPASRCLTAAGRARSSVDLDPKALYAQGLSASDVANAINAQSLILPSGIRQDRLAGIRRQAQQRARCRRGLQPPADPSDQRHHGLRRRCGPRARRLRRADQHRAPQRQPRAALLTVLKNGGSSTLEIVDSS